MLLRGLILVQEAKLKLKIAKQAAPCAGTAVATI